jgi:ABC-type spermidine/putrescine transport system permease subunit I
MPYCTLVIAYIITEGLFTTMDWVLGIGVSILPVVVMLAITMTRRKRAAAAVRAADA